jgi:hypothetical protein
MNRPLFGSKGDFARAQVISPSRSPHLMEFWYQWFPSGECTNTKLPECSLLNLDPKPSSPWILCCKVVWYPWLGWFPMTLPCGGLLLPSRGLQMAAGLSLTCALVEVGVRLRLDILIRQGFLEIIRYSSTFSYFSGSFLSYSYLKTIIKYFRNKIWNLFYW